MKILLIVVLLAFMVITITNWIRSKERNWLSIASDISILVLGILILSMFVDSLDKMIPQAVGITLTVVALIIITLSTIVEMRKK